MERELVLERSDPREIVFLARIGQRVEGLVRSVYIRLVVLVVVELHDLRRNMRLESTVVVWKIRKRVLSHDISLLLEQLNINPFRQPKKAPPGPKKGRAARYRKTGDP